MARTRRKLTGRETWYKDDGKKRKRDETELEKQTGVKLKIVERTGMIIIDLLLKSDPWIVGQPATPPTLATKPSHS